MDIARNFYKKAASSSGLRRFSWNRKKPRTLKFRIKFMLAVFVECTSISNQEFLPKDETNVWLKPDWVELTSVRYWSSLILASWTSCRCKLRVSKNHNSYQISKKKKITESEGTMRKSFPFIGYIHCWPKIWDHLLVVKKSETNLKI